MKYKSLSIIIIFLFLFVSCSKYKEDLPPANEIKLSRKTLWVDENRQKIDSLRILDGNGGYRVVFPKTISLNWGDGSGTDEYIDYSEEYLKVFIKNDEKIFVERTYVVQDPKRWFLVAYFLVIDSMGKRKIFMTLPYGSMGEFEGLYHYGESVTYDDNYWQF